MKSLFYVLCLSVFFVSCSSSDDNSNDDDDIIQTSHFSLRVNGDGYSDDRFELIRDSIEGVSLGFRFLSSDNLNNRLHFTLPTPIEINPYEIAPYNINNTSVSSITMSGDGIYLSIDGNITFTEIISDNNCITYKGNLNINYRRQDNSSGIINVQGEFEVPNYSACD